ncbi:hypothetical protein CLF_102152, partial [Clonorchis sinensis]
MFTSIFTATLAFLEPDEDTEQGKPVGIQTSQSFNHFSKNRFEHYAREARLNVISVPALHRITIDIDGCSPNADQIAWIIVEKCPLNSAGFITAYFRVISLPIVVDELSRADKLEEILSAGDVNKLCGAALPFKNYGEFATIFNLQSSSRIRSYFRNKLSERHGNMTRAYVGVFPAGTLLSSVANCSVVSHIIDTSHVKTRTRCFTSSSGYPIVCRYRCKHLKYQFPLPNLSSSTQWNNVTATEYVSLQWIPRMLYHAIFSDWLGRPCLCRPNKPMYQNCGSSYLLNGDDFIDEGKSLAETKQSLTLHTCDLRRRYSRDSILRYNCHRTLLFPRASNCQHFSTTHGDYGRSSHAPKELLYEAYSSRLSLSAVYGMRLFSTTKSR